MSRRYAQGSVRWIVWSAVLLGLVLAGAAAVWRWARPVVTVTEVVEAPVVQAFYSTGTISPEREFPIKAAIEGVLTEVHVDKGDRVTKRQILAVVSDLGLQFLLDKAKAELNEKLKLEDEESSPVLEEFDARLAATNDLLAIATREQNRLADIIRVGGASQTDLDLAIDRVKRLWSEVESLKAQRAAKKLELQREVEVARSAVNIAQWNIDEQTLRSPIDGVVLDRPASQGTRLEINGHVMNIADVRPANLVMRAAVDEEDKTKVRLDQPVRMTLYSFPGTVFDGTVSRIYDQADPQRRTFEIDVKLAQPNEQLSPGMTGELAFIMAEKDSALVVPSQAVQNGIIWTVRNGQLVKSGAEIGLRSVERIEVLTGLIPGERVVISPVTDLTEGQAVRTDYVDPTAAAGLNEQVEDPGNFKGFR